MSFLARIFSTAFGVVCGLGTYDYLLRPYWYLVRYVDAKKQDEMGMVPGALITNFMRREALKNGVKDIRIMS